MLGRKLRSLNIKSGGRDESLAFIINSPEIMIMMMSKTQINKSRTTALEGIHYISYRRMNGHAMISI